MVAMRGRPQEVTSDSKSNFVAADRELRELIQSIHQEKIVDESANNGIKWNKMELEPT